jgi:LDH2 family malate/lactate/ureidoglycolate dehydrogenase
MPIEHDMIGLYFAVGNANHMAPWGGIDLMLSTNPIAVGVPAHDEPPIVLDMASTVAAYGKVKAKLQRGEAMPEGWMIDRQGRPLTDPTRADEGLLLPIGGYKGYGLALVVGLLAGTLNGAHNGPDTIDFNKDARTPTDTGQAVVAISIDAFGDVDAFKRNVDELARALRGSRRLPGVERIRLPGEQSHAKRIAYGRDGIPLARELVRKLNRLADEVGVAPLST